MRKQKKSITSLKLVYALLFSICISVPSTICLANDGTKLTINGGDPISGLGSVLCWASVDQGEIVSCVWSADTSNDIAEIQPQENHQCRVAFTAFGSISLTCNATVMLNGNSKSASDSKTIRCEAPTTNAPTLKIDGPGEVSINSMHEYTAKYSGYEGTPRISWQYHGGTDSGERTTIHFLTNMTHHLECTLYYNEGNTEKSLFAEMYIKVLPEVSLTAMRADYKNYTNAVISGTNLVFIHFNVDDDDFSYIEDRLMGIGADCEQKIFTDGTDNDLCKVEISFGEGIKAEEMTLGTLFFEVPVGLRLWPSSERKKIFIENSREDGEPLEKNFSFSNRMDRDKIIPILTNGFYVEGVRPGSHNLKISFAANELDLPYFCCSVGGVEDQPDGHLRGSYKRDYPKLVDCEWCVKPLANTNYVQTYNCMAYAVDPNREIFNGTNNYAIPFEGAFWVYENDRDKKVIPGFDSWPNATNKWREDPFLYEVSFNKFDFNNHLKPEFKSKFNDISITPFTNNVGNTYYRMGYSSEFKKLLSDVMKEPTNIMKLVERKTTMALFNRDSLLDDIDNFFTLQDFASSTSNHHKLEKCSNINDSDRMVVYYSGYHAARDLSKTDYYAGVGNNIDTNWTVVVSKCGDSEELLIHLQEQITNYYGEIKRAYK